LAQQQILLSTTEDQTAR